MFKNGLRLPLHPFVQRWMAFLGVAPHQMNPNLLRTILCMCVLWKRHHGIEPSTNILRCCFGLRKSPKQAGFFYLQALQGKILENNPSSQKSWKDHWFFATGCWEVAAGVEKPRALVARRFREKVDWESGELSEDEEGQLEVIRALEASARDATELLSHSSLSASGLLDPITEAMGIDRNDPRARQLLEKLLKKGTGASGSGRKEPPPARPAREVAVVAPTPIAEARSPGLGRGQDRGKRPAGEEREAPRAKRPRVEEVDVEGAVVPTLTIHPERLADFVDTARMVLSGEMSWEGLTLGESTYASSTAMAFEQSVRALFSHYGVVRRVMIHREKDVGRVAELRRTREEAAKRDAEVKAVVDRAKRMADESAKKEVEAVRALGAAQVEKAELAKEASRLRERAAQLKEENTRLQKALENACKSQVEEVKSFLESEEGADLAGEVRLSSGLDLLGKIQKRYPDFVFNLEDLLGEDEDTGRGDIVPTPSVERQGAEVEVAVLGAEQMAVPREPSGETEARDAGV
ncbi:unnamed protein product [Prunus brigantina]